MSTQLHHITALTVPDKLVEYIYCLLYLIKYVRYYA